MNDLKSCPFCGKEAIILDKYIHGVANRKHYWIQCKAGCIKQMKEYRTKSKAVDAWNNRIDEECVIAENSPKDGGR